MLGLFIGAPVVFSQEKLVNDETVVEGKNGDEKNWRTGQLSLPPSLPVDGAVRRRQDEPGADEGSAAKEHVLFALNVHEANLTAKKGQGRSLIYL